MSSLFKTKLAVLFFVSSLVVSRVNAQGDKSQTTSTPGMRIEVLAIGTHEEEPQRWWQADGQSLEEVPFTWAQKRGVSDGLDRVFRRIAFRIQNLPKDASVNFSVQPHGYSPSGSRSAGASVLMDGKTLEDHFALSFTVPKGAKTMDLIVNIAKADWKTAGSGTAHGQCMFTRKDTDLSVIFSELLQDQDETRVVVTHNCFDKDYRIVAVAKDATDHPLKLRGRYGAKDFCQCTYTLPDLPKDQIECFNFQVREYKAFTIEELPLEPAK